MGLMGANNALIRPYFLEGGWALAGVPLDSHENWNHSVVGKDAEVVCKTAPVGGFLGKLEEDDVMATNKINNL